MQYRKYGRANFDVSLLGLGTMRLPVIGDDTSKIDEDKAIELIRYGVDNGVNYIDTAYPYHQGKSEIIVGKALKGGYRKKVKLVTKLPVWLAKSYEDFDKLLNEQLAKLDTDCIDVYLLHALNKDSWDRIKELNVLEFLDKALESGKIKHAGFSIHDDFNTFKEIVDSYDWTMCLIQQNYMDENEQVTSKGIKYAGEKGIAVAIMEPLKGGLLSKAPEAVQKLWDKAEVKRSPVEWSFKWIGNFPQVSVILSGMNDIEQLKENIDIMSRCLPNSLTESEKEIIDEVKKTYNKRIKVPCTKCKYCLPCPKGVKIPDIFSLYNNAYMYGEFKNASYVYTQLYSEENKGSNCIGCKKCENVCPQHIKISEEIKHIDEVLSGKKDFSSFHWNYIE